MTAFIFFALAFLYLFMATVFFALSEERGPSWDEDKHWCVAVFWPAIAPHYLALWVLGTF